VKALCLIYSSDERWGELSDADRKEMVDRYRAFAGEAAAAGKLVEGAEVRPASTATTVRVRNGETLLTDGPFAETREQLGGFFVLDCEDMDEAVALAAKIPGAQHGTVEVRPAAEEAS
jgi:hypothetical protein